MQKIVLFVTSLILSGCLPQAPAPIEFKSMSSSRYAPNESRSSDFSSSGIKKRQIKVIESEEPTWAKEEEKKSDLLAEEKKKEKPFETIKEVKEEVDTKSLEDEMSEAEGKVIELEEKPQKKEVGDIVIPENVSNVHFSMPASGDIISKFGEHYMGKKNNGINIAAVAGSDVKSVSDGVVIFSGDDPKFGNLIIIKHDTNDLFSAYAHMNDLKLNLQDRVTKSQVIGHVGQTGDVTKPQLHFAIRKGKVPVDPMQYLK